ncbi:lytic murein transglycosylase, partial [Candidatus Saccharibacteria bacterium]|nr:lytic murein transglycosylase [Candidatus Saccharibacteria bacterium]
MEGVKKFFSLDRLFDKWHLVLLVSFSLVIAYFLVRFLDNQNPVVLQVGNQELRVEDLRQKLELGLDYGNQPEDTANAIIDMEAIRQVNAGLGIIPTESDIEQYLGNYTDKALAENIVLQKNLYKYATESRMLKQYYGEYQGQVFIFPFDTMDGSLDQERKDYAYTKAQEYFTEIQTGENPNQVLAAIKADTRLQPGSDSDNSSASLDIDSSENLEDIYGINYPEILDELWRLDSPGLKDIVMISQVDSESGEEYYSQYFYFINITNFKAPRLDIQSEYQQAIDKLLTESYNFEPDKIKQIGFSGLNNIAGRLKGSLIPNVYASAAKNHQAGPSIFKQITKYKTKRSKILKTFGDISGRVLDPDGYAAPGSIVRLKYKNVENPNCLKCDSAFVDIGKAGSTKGKGLGDESAPRVDYRKVNAGVLYNTTEMQGYHDYVELITDSNGYYSLSSIDLLIDCNRHITEHGGGIAVEIAVEVVNQYKDELTLNQPVQTMQVGGSSKLRFTQTNQKKSNLASKLLKGLEFKLGKRVEAADNNQVLVFGDSIANGISSVLDEYLPEGWSMTEDSDDLLSKDGRHAYNTSDNPSLSGLANAETVVASDAGEQADVVVISLGANDVPADASDLSGSNGYANAMQDIISLFIDKQIILVGLYYEGSNYNNTVNAYLEGIAEANEGISYIDWDSMVSEDSSLGQGRDPHPSPAGYKQIAQAIGDYLNNTTPTEAGAEEIEAIEVSGVSAEALNDIPETMLWRYKKYSEEYCPGLDWTVIAGMYKKESNHGRYPNNTVAADGTVSNPIIGDVLTRSGERAIGPGQFLPSTWSSVGFDADGDGEVNAQDADDAIASSVRYICPGVGKNDNYKSAVAIYNGSSSYYTGVMNWSSRYKGTLSESLSITSAADAGGSSVNEGTSSADVKSNNDHVVKAPAIATRTRTTPRETPSGTSFNSRNSINPDLGGKPEDKPDPDPNPPETPDIEGKLPPLERPVISIKKYVGHSTDDLSDAQDSATAVKFYPGQSIVYQVV